MKRVNLNSIDAYITRRQLRWLGHVARMDQVRMPRKLLTSWVRHKRPRGAPEFTYGRGVTKALKKVDVGKDQWYSLAQDRSVWRSITSRWLFFIFALWSSVTYLLCDGGLSPVLQGRCISIYLCIKRPGISSSFLTELNNPWSTIYMEGTLTSGNDDWGVNRSMEWDHLLTSETLVLPTLTIRQYLFNMQTFCFKNFHDDS